MKRSDAPPPPPAERRAWPWTEAPARDSRSARRVPKISIVTPCLNQRRFLEETMRSVLLQDYPRLDYRVIDGGSDDGSVELIERYAAHLDGWLSEPDDGPADAIAKGWRQSSSDIVAYLNSDDVYLPGTLATVAETFARHPDAVGVCGWQLMINEEGYVVRLKRVEELTRRSLLELGFVPQPSIFVRRQALEECGGIDPRRSLVFDFDLWLRLSVRGRFALLPRVLSATRWHPDTLTVTRLAEVGRQLARVIDAAVAEDGSLGREEKRRLRFGALRLATLYQLEPSNRTWHAPFYLARSLWHAPDWGRRLRLLLAVWGRLRHRRSAVDDELLTAAADVGGERRTHWSHWTDDSPTETSADD